ncbi:MAG: hypothetical protein ABSG31_05230 [Tepidisphaeraceae bacterium]|jgi:hypothetical protein
MAKIVKIDPSKWEDANVVQLDVEAPNNMEAILALEDWAGEHGFARVRENFLRIIVKKSGKQVFRGVCFRITAEERKSVRFEMDSIKKRAEKIGATFKRSRAAG